MFTLNLREANKMNLTYMEASVVTAAVIVFIVYGAWVFTKDDKESK